MKTMRGLLLTIALAASLALGMAHASELDYGKPGEPVHLVVGYQPYYTEAWSGVVVNGLGLWKKYLPAGSTVTFHAGLQGAVIVNQMLAGKASIGYLGDMPSIVGASKRAVTDLRLVAAIGMSRDQCNVFFVRNDAPQFTSAEQAVRWLNGRTVAVPKGSCTDRFARGVFQKLGVAPSAYLNQSIEVITSGFRADKLDGGVVWEPVGSRLLSQHLARRVATGNQLGEPDGAFMDMRADLIRQRPDVVKAWLEAELDAEQYMADPKHAMDVARMALQQSTGYAERDLWQSLYGTFPAAEGGSALRMTLPFGFTADATALVRKATAFLFSVKAINIAQLPADAIQPQFAAAVLKERGLSAPVGTIAAQPDSAYRPAVGQ